MKKVIEIFYLESKERGPYSKGFLFVCEDGTRIEQMSTDPIADEVKEINK